MARRKAKEEARRLVEGRISQAGELVSCRWRSPFVERYGSALGAGIAVPRTTPASVLDLSRTEVQMATQASPPSNHQAGTNVRSRFTRRAVQTYPDDGGSRGRGGGQPHKLSKPDLKRNAGLVCKTRLVKLAAFCRVYKSYAPLSEEEPIQNVGPKFVNISRYGLSSPKKRKLGRIEATRPLAASRHGRRESAEAYKEPDDALSACIQRNFSLTRCS
jgi:hypothetical protein